MTRATTSSTSAMFQPYLDNRTSVIESQRLIEENIPPTGVAVFFVPSMLTPLFISPDDIIKEGKLFVLKPGAVLPEGLISAEKASDAAQLSTVLGRTFSMRKMLNLGVRIIVISESDHRARTDNPKVFVEEKEVNLISERYSENFSFHVISSVTYQQLNNEICAATYYSDSQIVAIRASQIHKPSIASTEVVKNPDISALLDLLAAEKIPHPIQPAQLGHNV